MSRINIAIIGGGLFAKEEHLPAVLKSSTLTLTAVYSRTLNSAASLSEGLAQKCEFYSDETADQGRGYDDLLAVSDIKAVIIALPIMSQPAYIKKALAAGKHVLSEKPIAENVREASELVAWYHAECDSSKVLWSVAENFRFFDTYRVAGEEIAKLGRMMGFRVRVSALVPQDNKWLNTSWRKTAAHQGGFVLDGGIHSIAGLRVMLNHAGEEIKRVACFTNQLQAYTAPLDTITATCRTTSGVAGTVNISFGTTMKGGGLSVACEQGVVTLVEKVVTIEKGGIEEKKSFPDEGNGVDREVEAWGKAIQVGKPDMRQTPEEGLKDLKTLEAMFRSGELDGAPQDTGL